MASQTISGQRWADGTTVGVYPAAAWVDPSQPPSGSAVTTAAVAGGAVTFAGLAENVRYVAYAGGVGVRFVVPQLDPTDTRSLRARLDELVGDSLPAVAPAFVLPGSYYGIRGDGGDYTSQLRAAMADLASATQYAVLELPGGDIAFSGEVDCPAGVAVISNGNDLTNPRTRVYCTAAGARFVVTGPGMTFGGFTIDGNNVGTQPLLVGGGEGVDYGAQRTFLALDVVNSAQDNVTIEAAQNMLWLACSNQNAARDGLVLDKGCGGNIFSRYESNASGRYQLRSSQSTATVTGAYARPTHNEFSHSLFERPDGANANVYLDQSENLILSGCVLQTGQAAPVVEMSASTNDVTLVNTTISGHASQPSAIKLAGSANKVVVDGFLSVTSCPFVFQAEAGGTILNYGELRMGAGVARATAATPVDATIRTDLFNSQRITVPSSAAAYFSDLLVSGEAGGRVRLRLDGLGVADGTNFSYITLVRRGDGLWGTSVGMVVGGQLRATTLLETVTITNLAANGTVALTTANGGVQRVNLAANATTVTFSNGNAEGVMLEVQAVQDATGTRTFAWPTSNVRYAGGAAPTTTTTPSRRDIVRFRWNHADTKWDEVSRSMAVG